MKHNKLKNLLTGIKKLGDLDELNDFFEEIC